MINDESGKRTLDYYIANQIKLRSLTSLVEVDGIIEIAAEASEGSGGWSLFSSAKEEEKKEEPVKVMPASPADVKRVLTIAKKVGLLPTMVNFVNGIDQTLMDLATERRCYNVRSLILIEAWSSRTHRPS